MRRLILAAALGLAAVVAIPAPAHAVYTTRHFLHYSPDGGLRTPIRVTCHWGAGDSTYLPQGTSQDNCNTEGVYVPAGEEIWGQTSPGTWVKAYDATGWHRADYWYLYGYTVRAD